nr:recombinase RecT [uncultured Dysosmobacter sp.]
MAYTSRQNTAPRGQQNPAPAPQAPQEPQAPTTGAMTPAAPQTPATPAPNASERFTATVMRQFGSTVGLPQVTDYQRQLVQGYFIAIDRALKAAEEERLRKNNNNRDHKYDNDLPVTWANVNLTDLALDVVHYARMGLDMMQDNHLFPIPYKNNKTRKYDLTLMPGYNGIQYIAEKYALEKPAAVTIELVYSTDTFKPIKKTAGVKVEAYEFAINNPFARGEVVGGFGYIEYTDPLKNKLVIMTLKDILKRKPQYASPNFWGGKQKVWEGGKQVEKETEGWFEEMCLKTLKREVYSAKHIPRDPKKVDDNYQYMKMQEARIADLQAQAEIDAYANGDVIDTTPELPPAAPESLPPAPEPPAGYKVDQTTGELVPDAQPAPEPTAPTEPPASGDGQTTLGGPEF